MLRNMLNLGGRLLLFAMITGALLGFVNSITKGPIDENARRNTEAALARVLPNIDGDAQEVEGPYANEGTSFVWLYKSGETVTGCAVKLSSTGYAGPIEMLVGIDTDGKVVGLEVLSHTETPGLGSVATEAGFRERFLGLTSPIKLGEGGVQAISGATTSSKAMVVGAEMAIDEAKRVMPNKK